MPSAPPMIDVAAMTSPAGIAANGQHSIPAIVLCRILAVIPCVFGDRSGLEHIRQPWYHTSGEGVCQVNITLIVKIQRARVSVSGDYFRITVVWNECSEISHGDRCLMLNVFHRHQLPASPPRWGCLARDQNSDRGQEFDSQPRPFCRTDHLFVVAHQSHNPLRAR
jgi:hypothetical protein